MSKLAHLIEDIFLGAAVGALLLMASGNAKAGEPALLVHPLPTIRPLQYPPRLPEPRAGVRQVPAPTYPEPRVSFEVSSSGRSRSIQMHVRF